MAVAFSITLCILLVALTIDEATSSLRVRVNEDGAKYEVLVNEKTWLRSGDTWFNADNRKFSVADGNLKFQKSGIRSGVDFFGKYREDWFNYKAAKGSRFSSEFMFKTYPRQPEVAVFSHKYVSDGRNTRAKSTDDTIGSFPSFLLPGEAAGENSTGLGYIAYGHMMAGWVNLKIGKWNRERANFSTGIKGGPIILFDGSTNAVVLSPLSHFTALSNMRTSTEKSTQISYGFMGGVDNVPKGYQADVIVYFSNQGINQAMSAWGEYVTRLYGKTSERRDTDLALTHLSYWTDAGAYYYYNTEKGKNYEDTMLDVVQYLHKIQLPVKYLQIDSFFYKKGHVRGTHSWTPQKTLFPHGFDYLYKKTNLPIGCHNRYWDNDTVYADYNGGKYQFLSDNRTGFAVAYDPQFWIDLFKNATSNWGKFILYEQDWFNEETDKDQALLTDIDLAKLWLKRMGDGADASNVTIMYCMEYCRHILQSVEIKPVTHARASLDYKPGNEQWRVGITSIFLDALKLAPFKDTFWTTSVQPGNIYNMTETIPFVQTMMATLSTGPVGPGDGIGYVNKDLLMKCCDSDGKILKPSRPVKAMDEFLKRIAFDESYNNAINTEVPNPKDEFVYTTYSEISSFYFLTLTAGFVRKPYDLTLKMGWPGLPLDKVDYIIYNATDEVNFSYQHISSEKSFTLGPDCKSAFGFYHASPVLWKEHTGGVVLIGERDKFVPLSPQRFGEITHTQDFEVMVTLSVNAKEVVTFSYFKLGQTELHTVFCNNSDGALKMENSYIQFSNSFKDVRCILKP